MSFEKSIIDRFFKYTKENSNGCLEWIGPKPNIRGYGRFWYNGKNISAHRFSWRIQYGDIPPNLNVCHSCDNPRCVNWKHLWLGTHEHNAKDRNLKGRNRKKRLTKEQEDQIALSYYTTDTIQRELAEKYQTTREIINKIIMQKHYRKQYGYKTIIRYRKITPIMIEEIKIRSSKGESKKELASSFNITPRAVRYFLNHEHSKETHNRNQKIRRSKLCL